MKAHQNKDIADLLLKKASEDERTIELIDAAGGPWGVGCFHCQQAAEKRLKAVLVIHQGEFPRSHDIGLLMSLVATYCPTLNDLPDEVMLLGDYGVAVRYDDSVIADKETFEDNKQWLKLIESALKTMDGEERDG